MELETKLEQIKEKLDKSFLKNVNLDMINFFVTDRYLVLVDLKYAKINKRDCIVLKCENFKGFVTKKKYRYLYLFDFEFTSDDVYISYELKQKWVEAMGKVNPGRVQGKFYHDKFLKLQYKTQTL